LAAHARAEGGGQGRRARPSIGLEGSSSLYDSYNALKGATAQHADIYHSKTTREGKCQRIWPKRAGVHITKKVSCEGMGPEKWGWGVARSGVGGGEGREGLCRVGTPSAKDTRRRNESKRDPAVRTRRCLENSSAPQCKKALALVSVSFISYRVNGLCPL